MKKRLYTLSQDNLDVIKDYLKEVGKKSNNQKAAEFAISSCAFSINDANKKNEVNNTYITIV
tara:strand:- start:620 stop:805 length:186 start_codon:yes stop_codon:yes gene_type:complete